MDLSLLSLRSAAASWVAALPVMEAWAVKVTVTEPKADVIGTWRALSFLLWLNGLYGESVVTFPVLNGFYLETLRFRVLNGVYVETARFSVLVGVYLGRARFSGVNGVYDMLRLELGSGPKHTTV